MTTTTTIATTLSNDDLSYHAPAHIDVGDAIIQALIARKVTTVYGVPGSHVLGLFDKIERDPSIQLICTASEEGAAFAADAEARLKGLGVCILAHGVGALKILNAVGGAKSGKSPLLVISGSPTPQSTTQQQNALMHHNALLHQRSLFSEVCVSTEVVNRSKDACDKIERVLDSVMGESGPGYLEVAWDCMHELIEAYRPCPPFAIRQPTVSSEDRETALILLQWLRGLKRPVVWAGIEVHRVGFGLQKVFHKIIEREGWKVATSATGKSLMSDSHVLSLGVYAGAISSEHVREEVEGSDGLLILGMPLNGIDTGMFTSKVDPKACAFVDMEVGMQCDGAESKTLTPSVLLYAWKDVGAPPPRTFSRNFLLSYTPCPGTAAEPKEDRPITTKNLIAAIDTIVTKDTVVLADVGVALFSAIDLLMPSSNQFLSSGFWATTGYALAGAIGAWFACGKRPIVLIGDGALLNCTNELATLARYNIPALVVVFDNGGHSTLRSSDGPYNSMPAIDHVSLANAMGMTAAERATNEVELWHCLSHLFVERSGPTLLSVCLDSSVLLNGTASSLVGQHNARKRKSSPSHRKGHKPSSKQPRLDSSKSYVTPDFITS